MLPRPVGSRPVRPRLPLTTVVRGVLLCTASACRSAQPPGRDRRPSAAARTSGRADRAWRIHDRARGESRCVSHGRSNVVVTVGQGLLLYCVLTDHRFRSSISPRRGRGSPREPMPYVAAVCRRRPGSLMSGLMSAEQLRYRTSLQGLIRVTTLALSPYGDPLRLRSAAFAGPIPDGFGLTDWRPA